MTVRRNTYEVSCALGLFQLFFGGRLICLLAPQSDFAHPTEIGIRSHWPEQI